MFKTLASTRSRGQAIEDFVAAAGVEPVLTDIGSAGASPEIWKPIAPVSTIIGFEPDERNLDPNFGEGFKRAVQVPKAVVPDDNTDTARFVLTEYPSCSSTLEADLEALSSFVFQDFFRPKETVSAPATSLNRVIADQGITGFHWIKIDSQGVDLQILKSLTADNLENLFAVDIEPGLIDAYKNEDLFPECHAWLKDKGFWMAEYLCQAYVKMRPETMHRLVDQGHEQKLLMSRLLKAPTCVEGRYLREVAWLEANASAERGAWHIAILFALVCNQTGYLFDLLFAYERLFGEDDAHAKASALAQERLSTVLG